MASYEQERDRLERETKQKRRRVLALTSAGFVVVIAAFVAVCCYRLSWIGFSAVALLILLGLIAKLGGQAVKNINQLYRHRLQLLDENAPSGKFNL